MELSITSWSLRACTLAEAAGITRALGIPAIDLGYFYGPALDRAAILADPHRAAETVRAIELPVASFYHLFGNGLAGRNLADPAHRDANERDFGAVAKFCRVIGAATLFVLPGICNPGQDRRTALDESAESLRRLLPIATDAGVTLTVEPHVHSYLESPALTLELLQRVPGLRLTLD
jgi:sugar phosphate isomerase/epimerase